MAVSISPDEIKMAQLMTILALIFFLLVSALDIVLKYVFGSSRKTTVGAFILTLYIWLALAMQSIGSGSIKDIVIFSCVFLIAFFYVKQNFEATK